MRHGLAAMAITVMAGTAAYAGGTRYNLVDVCRFDLEQYCKDIKKNRKKELKECLSKQKNLLPRCEDHLKQAN